MNYTYCCSGVSLNFYDLRNLTYWTPRKILLPFFYFIPALNVCVKSTPTAQAPKYEGAWRYYTQLNALLTTAADEGEW